MSLGLIGKKIGMTRVFDDSGKAVAVTVIDVSGNEFVQRKSAETDGYEAVQIGFDAQKPQRLTKPVAKHFEKHGANPKKVVREFRFEEGESVPEGEHPGVGVFQPGQWVDVIGTSKGKGFQGVYKRYNFGGLPMSHGSMMHRRTGSVGAGTTPGRVWKNMRMPGQHGNDRKTVQNLRVVQTRPDDNVILVSGAVPGAKGGYVIIRPAIKKPGGEAPAA
jgi:large subunit ribosomal protein L3